MKFCKKNCTILSHFLDVVPTTNNKNLRNAFIQILNRFNAINNIPSVGDSEENQV